MWIRSQDKKRLLNVNLIEISGNEIYGYQHAIFIGDYSFRNDWGSNNEISLGTYVTEARALAVLDEIHQGLITATQFYGIINDERIASVSVYQMPNE